MPIMLTNHLTLKPNDTRVSNANSVEDIGQDLNHEVSDTTNPAQGSAIRPNIEKSKRNIQRSKWWADFERHLELIRGLGFLYFLV
jgi:hypothetical protein